MSYIIRSDARLLSFEGLLRVPDEPFCPLQRVGPLAKLPRLVEEFGFDPGLLFDERSTVANEISDEDGFIPYHQAVAILARAAELTACPHIGLVLGSRMDANILGFAGQVMSAIPVLGDALNEFIGLQPFNSSGAVVYLMPQGKDYLLGYGAHQHNGGSNRYAYDLSLAVAFKVVSDITGGAAHPVEVLMCHDNSADRRHYEAVFKAPVHFNQRHAALVYSKSMLDLPVVTADPGKQKELLEIVWQKRSAGQPVSSRVRRLLRSMLLQNRGNMQDISVALGMNARVLRRKLAAEGATFQHIRDKVRHAVAKELLQMTKLPVGEIADALSFSHHSTFTRAFRRWSGQIPTQVRVDALTSHSLFR